MPHFVRVAQRAEIPESGGKCVEVEGKRIAIFRVGDCFRAIDDECTHQGAPLSEGTVEREEVECSSHGSRFDLRTGGAMGPPADEPVSTYNVRVSGETVEVEI